MGNKLYRSTQNRILGGVCGGIAEYFGLDPALVRIIWLVTIFAGGAGILAYIIAWILIPESPFEGGGQHDKLLGNKASAEIFGWILIAVGVLLIFRFFIPWFFSKYFWPLVLIALGAGIILKYKDRE